MLMMILMPSPQEAPHSSLSHMMGVVAREFGAESSEFYVEDGVLRVDRVVRDLSGAQVAKRPVFLLGRRSLLSICSTIWPDKV